MSEMQVDSGHLLTRPRSEGERTEMGKLGLLDAHGEPIPFQRLPGTNNKSTRVAKHPITNASVLNEAYDYATPSSFTRGLRIQVKAGMSMLYISGTASIEGNGLTIYRGDFRAQCWRTWRNIAELLQAEGADWHDILRTTCYLRDIERDYEDFNRIRTHFFHAMHLDPLPASTGIQARLCREDLLVEIEAIAVMNGGNAQP